MRWYWQLYCLLILGGGLVQMLRKILTDTGGPSSRYAALIIATIIIVAMVAHSRQKALGQRWLWQGLFGLLSLAAVLMLLFGIYLLLSGVFLSAGLLLLGGIAICPALYQLYQYSFQNRSIWS